MTELDQETYENNCFKLRKHSRKMVIENEEHFFIPIDKIKYLANCLLHDDDTINPQFCAERLQKIYDFEGKNQRAVLCEACSKRIGTKKCSKCSTAYYCGKACQLAAWSAHKTVCGNVHVAKKTNSTCSSPKAAQLAA